LAQSSNLDGGRELEIVRQEQPFLGALLDRIIRGVNRLAVNSGVGTIGQAAPPPPVDNTQVAGNLSNNVLSVPGEILHFVHTHNTPLQRGVLYVTEIATDSAFSNPHSLPETTSRSGFVTLPTNDSQGNQVSYYMRVTTTYPGSGPSKPTVYGGLQGPTQIQMGGSTNLTLLTSQGAGTSLPGQGGQGIGKVQARAAVGGPKRSYSSH
jgi:hypothetical protein